MNYYLLTRNNERQQSFPETLTYPAALKGLLANEWSRKEFIVRRSATHNARPKNGMCTSRKFGEKDVAGSYDGPPEYADLG